MINREIATFGGGCFWCIEAVVQRLKGVEKIVSGYAGGHDPNPKYRAVCAGATGHAEVVQVTYDPSVISFEDLITIFMTSHDPTTLNQQGADKGTQYRSVIYYHNDEQRTIVERVINGLKSIFSAPIVTEIVALDTFFPGESYHQNYFNNNKYAGYCRVVIEPKIRKLREQYSDKIIDETAN